MSALIRTLKWLHENEMPGGGIAAWPGKGAYPEVTGYLLPTLFDYGERLLARDCARWLITVQDKSGAWPGLDGNLYAFDTAAVVEGFLRFYRETGQEEYNAAAQRGIAWLKTLRNGQGFYIAHEGGKVLLHSLRINGVLNDDPGRWMVHGSDRMHYIAYALEGYLKLGYAEQVKEALTRIPFRDDGLAYYDLRNWQPEGGSDVIATAQIAILKIRTGLDAGPQVEAVRRFVRPNGGVLQSIEMPMEMSWGAKFYLDMEKLWI